MLLRVTHGTFVSSPAGLPERAASEAAESVAHADDLRVAGTAADQGKGPNTKSPDAPLM
jgi:hypothetical protein